ncbi:MAG TPA: IPT/TIG domain-containing protein [Thermoanaerobaculia bacterium]
MKTLALGIALLFFATAASAAQVITSITPSSGPVTGGTQVTIRGSGLSFECAEPCQQEPGIYFGVFGDIPAASQTLVDSTTIIATTPPGFPGDAAVQLYVGGNIRFVIAPAAFTYVGDARDAFEPLMLPILSRPAHGAFGATFVSSLNMWTPGPGALTVYGVGIDPLAPIGGTPTFPLTTVLTSTTPQRTDLPPVGDPGWVIWIPKGSRERLAASLRVMEVTRELPTMGTSIPIVPEGDFRSGAFALLDLPANDPHFRSTLRVYSLDSGASVHVRAVRLDGKVTYAETDLTLTDPSFVFFVPFDPGYAQYALPAAADRVEITPNEGHRVWAFVTITQNETQHITVVAPN